MDKYSPIGFFDSGLGGISILRGVRRILPFEDCIYYGDSAHAPYGVRSVEEVQQLSLRAVEFLLEKGAKAIVIACNTATSASVAMLRERYPQLTIIGTEPAIKPAVQVCPDGRILVMATAMTLQEQKFLDLWENLRSKARIIPVPCTGLMEFVERGQLSGEEVEEFLRQILRPHLGEKVDGVVLGCTHYPFLKETIRTVIGPEPVILDSADGVARQLRRKLDEKDLLCPDRESTVTLYNTSEQEELMILGKKLLETEE